MLQRENGSDLNEDGNFLCEFAPYLARLHCIKLATVLIHEEFDVVFRYWLKRPLPLAALRPGDFHLALTIFQQRSACK